MQRVFHFVLAAALAAPALVAQNDSTIQAAVEKALKGHPFQNLQFSVQDRVVALSGSVDLYVVKIDAEQRVSRVQGIEAIRDQIQIAGPEISDPQLQTELEKSLQTADHPVYIKVHNGVVMLGGYADRRFHAAAVATIMQTRGVKGLHDVLETDKASPFGGSWSSAAPPIGGLSTR